jgi:hypothetical protein
MNDEFGFSIGIRAWKRIYLIIECGGGCVVVEELAATEGESGKRQDGTMDIHGFV